MEGLKKEIHIRNQKKLANSLLQEGEIERP